VTRLVELATRRTFRSLRVRNYRLFFFGQLVSVSGTWMQQIAQDWLVLRLSGRALPVGIATALQFLPTLLFGFWTGLAADRLDKRRLLVGAQIAMGGLALVLGVLTVTGAVRVWMVYVLAFLLGCAMTVDMPARQAFVVEMVGPDKVVNAVSLNSAMFNSARVVGPAFAGVLISAFGIAPAFFVNAVSFLAVIAALLAMDPSRLHRGAPAPRSPGQVRAGISYVWATPVLRSTLLLVAIVGTLTLNSRVVLPLLARFTFDGDASLYGTLASVMAVGSVVGALGVARRGRPTRRLLLGAATAFGVSATLAAVAPSVGTELVALCLLGGTSIAFLATANSTLQLNSSSAMRGRVMALYGLLFLGTTPLGSLLVGWLAERYGPRSGLVLAGVGALVAVAVAAVADALHRRTAETAETAEGEPSAAPSPGAAA
jgi:MFS family permease